MEKFEVTVQNVSVPVRQRSARSVENIATAEVSVEESPNVSLTRRSQASLGHLCDVVVANFAKCSWPTSSQNQIDSLKIHKQLNKNIPRDIKCNTCNSMPYHHKIFLNICQ